MYETSLVLSVKQDGIKLRILDFFRKTSHVDQKKLAHIFLSELRGQNSYHRFLGKPEKILDECFISLILNDMFYMILNDIATGPYKKEKEEAFLELLHTVLSYYCFDEKYNALIEIGKTMRLQKYPKDAIVCVVKQKTKSQKDIEKIILMIYQ